jgi:hypothetical protein
VAKPTERRRYEQTVPDDDDMLEEYDFSNAEIGKYAKRYAEGTNVVVLDPDVAAVFKTDGRLLTIAK